MSKCTGSNTSVYTGCFTNDYLSILHQDYQSEQRHAAMGLVPSMMANRLSWFFNLKGTSMVSNFLFAPVVHICLGDDSAGNPMTARVYEPSPEGKKLFIPLMLPSDGSFASHYQFLDLSLTRILQRT